MQLFGNALMVAFFRANSLNKNTVPVDQALTHLHTNEAESSLETVESCTVKLTSWKRPSTIQSSVRTKPGQHGVSAATWSFVSMSSASNITSPLQVRAPELIDQWPDESNEEEETDDKEEAVHKKTLMTLPRPKSKVNKRTSMPNSLEGWIGDVKMAIPPPASPCLMPDVE